MASSRALGDVVDLLYQLREKRLALNRQADEITEQEKALRTELLAKMAAARTSAARGKLAMASRYSKQIAVVKDSKKFLAYVMKTGDLDLVTVSARLEACADRWNVKETVPGVVPDQVIKISLTKVKKTGR